MLLLASTWVSHLVLFVLQMHVIKVRLSGTTQTPPIDLSIVDKQACWHGRLNVSKISIVLVDVVTVLNISAHF